MASAYTRRVCILFILVAGLAPATASAANGQCRWEGGPGAPQYPACTDEDCTDDGGLARCVAPEIVPPAGTAPGLADAAGWSYRTCSSGHSADGADWCIGNGGAWSAEGRSCTALPAGIGMWSAGGDARIAAATDAYWTRKTGDCGGSRVGDTGWGETDSGLNCWGGQQSRNGVLLRDFRKLTYSAGGNCSWLTTYPVMRHRALRCPHGSDARTHRGTGALQCVLALAECCAQRGNPVHLLSGAKLAHEVDYAGVGPGALRFERYYHGHGYRYPDFAAPRAARIDDYWRHGYAARLWRGADGEAAVTRADGALWSFAADGTPLEGTDEAVAALEPGAAGGAELRWHDGSREVFGADGRLQRQRTPEGLVTVLAYDASGRLVSVTDPFGRVLAFGYDPDGRLALVRPPDGTELRYGYDAAGRLARVTYADGAARTYHYEAAEPWLLTGITDAAGRRLATYEYDGQGRVTRSTRAGGALEHRFVYVRHANPAFRTTRVTDPVGTAYEVKFRRVAGAYRVREVTAPCADCGPDRRRVHDAAGRLLSREDFRGFSVRYVRDADRGRELERTEGLDAAGRPTPATRTVRTEWHPFHPWPVRVIEPSGLPGIERVTQFDYDGAGRLLRRSVAAAGAERRWAWTYDAAGRVIAADGPRTDVDDTVRYEYYAADDPCLGCRGRLRRRVEPAGHVLAVEAYDPAGRVLRVRRPNGLVLAYAYDPRGRPLAVVEQAGDAGVRETRFAWTPAGELAETRFADGRVQRYEYDAAQRLVAVIEADGRRLEYRRDGLGQVVEATWREPDGSVSRQVAHEYDAAGRRDREIVAGLVTELDHDAGGLLVAERDPRFPAEPAETRHEYDALGRRTATIDAAGGVTRYTYDAAGQLVRVVAPNGATTTYRYDALGLLVAEASPDRGLTVFAHDPAGNLVCRADALAGADAERPCDHAPGHWRYRYDAQGRLASIDIADTPWQPDRSFTWDLEPASIGQLGIATAQSDDYQVVTEVRWHDRFGQLRQRLSNVVAGYTTVRNLWTGFDHDAAGRRARVSLPNGRLIEYAFDALGRPRTVTTRLDGASAVLVAEAEYTAFDAPRRLALGNGLTETWRYDDAGRAIGIAVDGADGAVADRTYTLGPAGHVLAIVDAADPAGERRYGYDLLGRLVADSTLAPPGTPTYTYDANGNRLAQDGPVPRHWQYAPASNRLVAENDQFVFTDAAGNTLHNAARALTLYPGRDGRAAVYASASAFAFARHSALGELAHASIEAFAGGFTETQYQFDPDGRPLALWRQRDQGAVVHMAWAWLDARPVAQVEDEYAPDGVTHRATRITWLHPDPLGTPRLGTDEQGVPAWRWRPAAFGQGGPDLARREVPLRFPGQVALGIADVHYNYFRSYDPGSGRYLESDPAGIAGGLNGYAYALGDPLGQADPLGLQVLPLEVFNRVRPQEPGCDGIPERLQSNICMKKCCDAHDDCYERHRCTLWSWVLRGGLFTPRPCADCNRDVIDCILTTGFNCRRMPQCHLSDPL